MVESNLPIRTTSTKTLRQTTPPTHRPTHTGPRTPPTHRPTHKGPRTPLHTHTHTPTHMHKTAWPAAYHLALSPPAHPRQLTLTHSSAPLTIPSGPHPAPASTSSASSIALRLSSPLPPCSRPRPGRRFTRQPIDSRMTISSEKVGEGCV